MDATTQEKSEDIQFPLDEAPDFPGLIEPEQPALEQEPLPRKKVIGFGDNHGCNPEFLKHDLMLVGAMALDGKLNPAFEGVLVQIGDVLDRGQWSKEIFLLWRELQDQAPDKVIRLLGNHDLYHLVGCPSRINASYIPGMQEMLIEDVLAGRIDAAWAEGDLLYTHAGLDLQHFAEYRDKTLRFIVGDLNRRFRDVVVEMKAGDPSGNYWVMEKDRIFSDDGIFWTRGDIENTQFRQVVGHTPQWDGIKAEPGMRVKYIDGGRVFDEDGSLGDRLRARNFLIGTDWGPHVHRQLKR